MERPRESRRIDGACDASPPDASHREWQGRYESAVRAIGLILYDWDAVQGTLTWDGAAERITGDAVEHLGDSQQFYERIHPDDREALVATIEQAMRAVEPIVTSYRISRDDGTYVRVASEARVLADANGRPVRIVGFLRDLSESDRAAAALSHSEERYRVATDTVNGIVYEVDLATGNVERSAGIRRVLGYDPESLGTNSDAYRELIHPDDLERARAAFWRAAESEGTGEVEYRVRDARGEYRVVWDRMRAMRDAQGSAVRVIGILMDVTEQRAAEAEVRRLNAELELRVAQRTAQLEELNNELEAFTYSVSHDLRAPLRHVAGFTQLLRSQLGESIDVQAARYMDTILGAAARMGELIDKLLLLSRIDQAALKHESVDVAALLAELRPELEAEHEGRRIEWQAGALPIVIADRSLLRIVLTNLLSNALKFTRPREVARISIEYELEPGGNDATPPRPAMHIFRIRDNGVGFDMRYADKLFGAFQRLHAVDEFEGSGIGLASTRRIVQRHGGRVWAQSALDQGATFGFSLPVERA